MTDSKEKKIVGGIGAAAIGAAGANVAYQLHREDTKSTRRREKANKEFKKKLDASTRKQNEVKVKNLQKKLDRLQNVKNKKPFNQSSRLGKDLNLQIKNLKNQITDLKPSNFVKGIKTAVKLAKSVTPVGAIITAMTPAKTATDEQMKKESEKMQNKNKGGQVGYTQRWKKGK